MSPFRVSNDYEDTTVVSNIFIDEYMEDANDAQIKVYLYLTRMIRANKEVGFSDIVNKFNYTEKDIILALKYWEKNKLLGVKYDEHKNPVEIHLKKILASQKALINNNIMSPPAPESAVDTFVKPEYSVNEMKRFKEMEETSQLLFVVEKYLKKRLTPSDIQTIFFFIDVLHFSNDLIDYLIQYCVEHNKRNFPYIEGVARKWAEEGITTPKQAANAAKFYKIVYDVMKALGNSNEPTKVEADFVKRWVQEFGFSSSIIHEACGRTVLAVNNRRFEYCNKILSNWNEKNIRTKADIKKLDAAFVHKPATDTNHKNGGKINMFHQYKQNTYDFEALEKEMFSNYQL